MKYDVGYSKHDSVHASASDSNDVLYANIRE